VRGFDDPRMDRAVDAVRQSELVRTLDKNAATGPMIGKLREGWVAGVLADQNPRENGAPVRFFGAPTWGTIGPALIARRARVPIYPVSMVRDGAGVYTLVFYPPLELQSTGDLLADLTENTQRCQDAIEAMVRACPGQWLWFHRRWRSRERLAREWAARLARRGDRGGAEGQNTGASMEESQ
jgi:KDO2-lipid IV(A) lauroyltransferase